VRIPYEDWSPSASTQETLDQALEVIKEYDSRGYELTLRQLYYQMVARGLVPNRPREYNRLGRIISRGRRAGLVSWWAIEDRTRQGHRLATWDDPADVIQEAIDTYRIDKWKGQNYRVFVWVEKEALAGVIERACFEEAIQVKYLSCRGYMSDSTIWNEARAMIRLVQGGIIPVVLHLADHDPSGVDMSRDNRERLTLYSGLDPGPRSFNNAFIFKRIALNMDQIEQYNPPPNPAKLTDSRSDGYVAQYGRSSWELDALDPDVLVDLVQEEVMEYRDNALWNEAVDNEQADIERLSELLGHI